MGLRSVLVPPLRLDATDEDRLRRLGFVIVTPSASVVVSGNGPAPGDEGTTPDLAEAILLGGRAGAISTVVGRGTEPRGWRREGAARLEAVTNALRVTPLLGPLALVVLPARSAPRPGAVAVLSPAGSVSSHEIYVGAALAASSGRRVEHLNGRGTAGSAIHWGVPGRAAVRAASPDWHERAAPRPERALATLSTRPAVIVVPVLSGAVHAAPVVADHPDADVVLLFDVAHARHGPTVARQVASIVENAAGVELSFAEVGSDHGASEPGPAPVVEPTTRDDARRSVRASDVIHVRLTDVALELTNRTTQQVHLRVTLGAASGSQRVRAVFEASLEAGETHAEPTDTVAGVADLASPTRVVWHGSHGTDEVYEGGERRILAVETAVVDAAGVVRGRRRDDAPNGVDFSITARALTTLVGEEPARPALPEPAPHTAARSATQDLFAALETALAVGADVLARHHR